MVDDPAPLLAVRRRGRLAEACPDEGLDGLALLRSAQDACDLRGRGQVAGVGGSRQAHLAYEAAA